VSATTPASWSLDSIARVVLWPYAAIVAAFIALAVSGRPDSVILHPVLVVAAIMLVFILALTRGRLTELHPFEIGPFYAALVFLSAVVPGLSYAAWRNAALNEMHWFEIPSVDYDEVGVIVWWYAVYLAAFCVAYLIVRGKHVTPDKLKLIVPSRATTLAIIIPFLASKLVFVVLGLLYNLNPASYSDRYLLLRQLPVLAKQIANIAEGFDLTMQLFLLVALYLRYRTGRWLIALFIGFTVVMHLLYPGSRTEMMMVLVAAMMLYDLLVKRLSMRAMLLAALAAVTLYLAIGILRRMNTEQEVEFNTRSVIMARTDFDGIFGNALDLKFVRRADGAFIGRPDLYLADIIGFIPRQLLPFEKTSASQWYVMNYHPQAYELGGGRAFGIIAEAIVGHGKIELIWRGALFGIFLALVQRRLVSRPHGLYFIAFYVWLAVWSYQAARNTMFMLPTLFLYRFLTAMVAVSVLGYFLRRWVEERPEPA
jgi:hypothetical protein